MSLGYCAKAVLEMADEKSLLYMYNSYNINLEGYEAYMEKYDGVIIIDRASLVEPEIHMKRVRRPSGKKVYEEKIIEKEVQLEALLKNGSVKIENSCGAWNIVDGYDVMALNLVRKIFKEYQRERKVSENVVIVK